MYLYRFSVLEPHIIYQALLRDSKWWQGLKIRQGLLNNLSYGHKRSNTIQSPLDGIDLNLKSAQKLAESIDVMIKDEIKLLNFGK